MSKDNKADYEKFLDTILAAHKLYKGKFTANGLMKFHMEVAMLIGVKSAPTEKDALFEYLRTAAHVFALTENDMLDEEEHEDGED